MPLLDGLRGGGRVLLLGSGGLTIGQAGEFDYSGTQAVKALREEGLEVLVVNPNIATVQTDPEPGTRVFLYPVEPSHVERIIASEKPHAILAGFGGQTALNCLLALDASGALARHGVVSLGTSVEGLRTSEDRRLFSARMDAVGMPVLPSRSVSSVDAALRAAEEIGYPVMIRASYALGGLSSGVARTSQRLRELAQAALLSSPEALIERSLHGWKEIEYEVMRDREGNAITICNMENFDPLGIHTGDSIVACPSQTLTDDEFQTLRSASLAIAGAIGVVGECNVQYALDPKTREFYVIEVNARLSRSSALASKASGYPIAYIAAKLVLGYDLLELKNPVTGVTTALYEPALDYVTVKIPRWDMSKFVGASRALGSAMKSVGEVMGIGRTFQEALQKAVRMVTEKPLGLSARFEDSGLENELREPTDRRLFAVAEALRRGMALPRLHELTAVDPWFLSRIGEIVAAEREVASVGLAHADSEAWRRWKQLGFGDEQLARLCGETPERARALRLAAGVRPFVKKIDTTAGEYPSPSNYLYLTYGGTTSDAPAGRDNGPAAVVLGGGPYRVGSSVEFDWCAVSCSRELRAAGWRSAIVNCNPETVSTDYNSSDRLYFDELTLERILDIVEQERADGVVACMGGQLPNCLAETLSRAGARLLGHDAQAVDRAEDRGKFSAILDRVGIAQPEWVSAASRDEVDRFVARHGFPLMVRPSYVLSGSSMNVAYDAASLDRCLKLAADLSTEHPVVLSRFVEDAVELEIDGVASAGSILAAVASEHIEHAGTHSGDATSVLPPRQVSSGVIAELRTFSAAIAKELSLNGPFNIQFLHRQGKTLVIECNARASRSFPFVSKVSGIHLARLATRAMIGISSEAAREPRTGLVGVKAAMFSFRRMSGADPLLRVEMTSTGEVGCVGTTFDEALILALEAAGHHRPKRGLLVSSGTPSDKARFLALIPAFDRLALPVYATPGTAAHLAEHGHPGARVLAWPGGGGDDVLEAIRDRRVDLVINIPKNLDAVELEHSREIRLAAVRFGCSLFTDMQKVAAYLSALDRAPEARPRALPAFGTDGSAAQKSV
jgi:carbamoyl-phosphate synthase large subunit